jgi:hypothetical protein
MEKLAGKARLQNNTGAVGVQKYGTAIEAVYDTKF